MNITNIFSAFDRFHKFNVAFIESNRPISTIILTIAFGALTYYYAPFRRPILVDTLIYRFRNAPLVRACNENNIEWAQQIINSGCNVNIMSSDGITPLLQQACWNNNMSLASLLIQNGADVNSTKIRNWSPLQIACNKNNRQLANLLIQNGANVNSTGHSPLHMACRHPDSIPLTRLLIQNGADINAVNGEGRTPLSVALDFNQKESVEFLLENGADANAYDDYGLTPFIRACQDGELLRIFLKTMRTFPLRFQKVREREITGKIARPILSIVNHQIKRKRSVQSCIPTRILLNLDPYTSEGKTALHVATLDKNLEVIEQLLNAGAQMLPEHDGKTPWDLANGNEEILALFKKYSFTKS